MKTTLSERLKLAMTDGPKKVTGKALAQACGVSAPSVSDWLNGNSKTMGGTYLLAAAEHLQVRPKWLADGVGPMRPDHYGAAAPHVSESTLALFPPSTMDSLTAELLALFALLDEVSKRDFLNQLRGFVMGRRPHTDGNAPAMAG